MDANYNYSSRPSNRRPLGAARLRRNACAMARACGEKPLMS